MSVHEFYRFKEIDYFGISEHYWVVKQNKNLN